MTIEEVKEYYGRKYSPIITMLKNKNFYNYSVDKECYGYLQVSFESDKYYYTVNHGINAKHPYNLSMTPKNSWNGTKTREHFRTQFEAALSIKELE